MASTPKISATSPSSGPTPVSGWGRGGGNRFSSGDEVNGVNGSAFSQQGGWRPHYDDRHGQGYFFFGQYPQKEEPKLPLFTPLMALLASAFGAVAPVTESRAVPPMFITDFLRGIGIYEFNLRAISGTLAPQGAVVNRYG